MEAEGETVTVSPLFTAMFPGVIVPDPPEKTAVSCVELPTAIDDEAAEKLEIEGGGTSVTVATSLNRENVVPSRTLVTFTLYSPT